MDRKKLIIRGILTLTLTGLLLGLTARVLRKKEGYEKNQEFYASGETYDVLFFGSSHAVMGVLPMELWNDYGITSYNLANNGQTIPVDYWLLKDALDRKTPALVVMDVYMLYSDEKYGVMEYAHGSLDPMPFSKTKAEAVCDIFPEGSRMEFILPFSVYHNRWDSITPEFFRWEPSPQKGAYENHAKGKVLAEPMKKVSMTVEKYEKMPETVNKEYLRKAIELCRERKVPILLAAAPFNEEVHLAEWTNGARELAEEYRIPFVNGAEKNLIRTNCDLYDSGHLNSSGARKWTAYLGAYISDHYGLADKRGDGAYSGWNEDYRAYRDYKEEELIGVSELYPLLMLLNDREWKVRAAVKRDSWIDNDRLFWEFLSNAGIPKKEVEVSSFSKEDLRIWIYDRRTGRLIRDAVF